MKFSLSGRQPLKLLQQTEEILLDYKDIDILFDYEKNGLDKKDIVIAVSEIDTPDWELIASFNEKMNITVRLDNILQYKNAIEHNLKFYWGYMITTWYDLQSLLKLGVDQVLITMPLTFSLPKVREFCQDKKIRICANQAYEKYLICEDGIKGFYVRPEDIEYYSTWVDVVELIGPSLKQQAAAFEIYHNDKFWPGNLNLLIHNLHYDIDNRVIPEEFAINRVNCGQRCQSGGSCHICDMIFKYVTILDRSRFDWDFEKHQWKIIDK